MSALPRGPRDIGYAGLRMTADEYLALGETQERYELIDGLVVMSPSPTPLHQDIKQEIAFQIRAAREPKPKAYVDTDVRLGPTLVYCPDVSVYRPGRLPPAPARLTEPPDLIIEVLSPSNKPLDLITKRNDYERFGVGEYWILDPDTLELRRFLRQGASFAEAPSPGTPAIPCASVPGLTIDLAALKRAIGR